MVLSKQPSPYSLMYLVTPAIYEKLLLCLDEGDKRLLDSLNKSATDEAKRPSEEIADIITSSEVAQSSNLNTSLVGDQGISKLSFTQPIHYGTQVREIKYDKPDPDPASQQPPVVVQPQIAVQPPVGAPAPSNIVAQPQVVAPTVASQVIPTPAKLIQPQITSQPAQQPIIGPPVLFNNPPLPKRIIERNKMFAEMDKIRRATIPGPPAQFQRSSTPIDASMHSDFTIVNPESNEPSFEVINEPERQYPPMKKWDGKRKRDDFPVPPAKRRDHELHLARDERYHADRFKRRQNRFMQGDPYFNLDFIDPVDWQPIDPADDVPFRTPQQCISTTTGGRICQPQPQASFKPISARMRERYQKLKELDSKLKQKKSRFVSQVSDDDGSNDGGSELEAYRYDPSKDVPFRKPKPIKKTFTKRKSFRCSLCQSSLTTLYALKNHITKVHNRDPNEVISEMASEMFSKPTQGSSTDFTNWNTLRAQPKRAVKEKKKQGGKGKQFHHWL